MGWVRETGRIVAVGAAALVGGAGLLLLITQVIAPASAPLRARGIVVASPTPPPTAAPLPTLPPAIIVPPPPTVAGAANADRYLQDLTTAPGTLPGEIAGLDYRFEHGFGMALSTTTQQEFAVPSGYQSMSTSLKAVGATVRFTLSYSGRTLLDRTLSPFQPPVSITCATPYGSAVVLSGLFEGGGTLTGAVALWGDARFSKSPAPAAGCS
jgi:hypothetical protein